MPSEPLGRRIAALPPSPYAPAALHTLREAAARKSCAEALENILDDADVAAFLGSALGDCPFLLDLAGKDPERLAAIVDIDPETRLERQISELAQGNWDTRADAMQALRRAKQNVALTLGLADLARAIPLRVATDALTAFADGAINAALRFALADAERSGKWVGGAEARGLFILALGKHGAHELNYSSDVDLIAMFEPEAPGLAPGVEPSTFWVRIVRTLVTLLQERTADGYVFRVDLRLRPDPAATAVAISAPAALIYYESMGQNWERAALIKARAAAGDIATGEAFLAEIAPFIWRKYLDFAAIADIHSIKRQVHAHRGHASVRVLGHDIKRGRGGIREIEFFVQTQQLIAGGRDRGLRGRETCAMLEKLAEKGWIDAAVKKELEDAYVFLRTIEHRLQMVRDEQTHTMPHDRTELARIARLTGYADSEMFEADIRRTLETVARRYSELFEEAPDLSAGAGSLVFTGGEDDPDTLDTLRRLGFEEPQNVTHTIRGWHFGRFAAMRSSAARESLTEITPALLDAFARSGNPDAVFRAFDALLKALPAGAQLFALLTNNRELLDLLATILGAAPRLAETFARRPHVVDALIDPASFGAAGGKESVENQLAGSLAEAKTFEDGLDRTRLFAAEQRFLVSAGLLRGAFGPTDAGKRFSDVAEAVTAALFERTLAEFERQHGRLPGGKAAILAFGRLGSREMTVASDLDLIVIYDHEADAASSDGKRPLSPSQYYSRLTQRLVAALSAPTAEGVAYQVDLRLRPSGRAGPLATHIEAFEHYQLNDAWTWEHMAMSRGRPIAGDAELVGEVSAALDRIVSRPHERSALASDIAEMRGRIERDKPAANAFDVKLARGGLIDCEFAAQFLVLSGMGRIAGESTRETLRRAVDAGFMEKREGDRLAEATALQGAILQIARIADDKPFDPAHAPEALKRLVASVAGSALPAVAPDPDRPVSFEALSENLAALQGEARSALESVLGRPVG
ncbi:MAG: bifunctional [glutamine synthetase] adenylyltransferase/[glutamine synthetase]-adenylyl-L-tyrosine phosphorylase [Pseudomonadota bacterium]|nr:bifunctional [glutamine synthetase] adenylyltransferase/[glutamine synthetase]-adenylyl-L-tyrosine phosphorylase [Pseudomonadota bacterium]